MCCAAVPDGPVLFCHHYQEWLTPKFTSVKTGSIYELRVYDAYTVARTQYQKRLEARGNDSKNPHQWSERRPVDSFVLGKTLDRVALPPPQGLARLVDYFEKGNSDKLDIPSTQPLTMRYVQTPEV